MDELWIQEEDLQEALKEHFLPFRIFLTGGTPKVYCSSVEANPEKSEMDYLIKFLFTANTYPLYLSFSVEYFNLKEYEAELDELGLEYELNYSTTKKAYYVSSRVKRYYSSACFCVKLMDAETVAKAINAIYGIAQSNEFFMLSSEDNVRFDHKETAAVIEERPESFFIIVGHDGHGFYLFSNEERYSSITRLIDNLPEGTVVTQINNKLIDEID